MQEQHSNQSSFFSMIYEELIPADYLLRQLAAAVYSGFVSDLNQLGLYAAQRPMLDIGGRAPVAHFCVLSFKCHC